ncbi:HAD family hydrolase [Aquabacterium humicola]|uniref:HAD family hydrolase n=1 Tax=Aquabacterium humicola TaxID=3237377 RepID=UPI002543D399|nr:HAD family phosphatase [Rubrivivax pictus]
MVALTLFDLDHTLLDGDSDVLWCEFLMDRGVLDRDDFGARNAAMDRDYRAGTVSAQDFCAFYVSTLAGRSLDAWQPLRRVFLDEVVAPRIKPAARALVQRHAEAGELLVMTTATNRFITELTAAHLGLPHLIATECERLGDGFSGRPAGTLNMREGKVARLQAWLAERQIRLDECRSTLYSDSINDLPLMSAVKHAVAVDPDPRLQAEATARGWPVISLMH